MSVSLSAERDRLQRQVEELEQSLSVTQTELELLSSDTGTYYTVYLSLSLYLSACLSLTVLVSHWIDEESDDDVIKEEAGQVMHRLSVCTIVI